MAVKDSNDFGPDEESNDLPRHGSIRKVLHSLVATDSLLGKSAKMLDRPKCKGAIPEQNPYTDYLNEYAIIAEYNSVVDQRIPGVYVVPSANSELLWFGVIFIRSGIYRGGVFRFILHIPESFPNCSHPSLIFETAVFHPSIDTETLELNLKSVFTHWSKGVNHIWQVLDYTRSIFYQIPKKGDTNKLAAQLYGNDKEEYFRQVRICVRESQSDIYKSLPTDDAHYLRFEQYDENKHGETLSALKTAKSYDKTISHPGLSWVKAGTLKPCSAAPYF